MKTLEEIANHPAVGDFIILRGGHIRYVVMMTGGHGLPANDLSCTRTAVRTGPSHGAIRVTVSRETWFDLMTFAASQGGRYDCTSCFDQCWGIGEGGKDAPCPNCNATGETPKDS